MRAPAKRIHAPEFPVLLKWVNVPRVRMDRERGHPVLLEFWDFCRPNSLRTLPYVKGWHERYSPAGLQVIGVHCPGFPPSRETERAVRDAVARLQIPYPVLIDPDFEVWRDYGNAGWPARYLWDAEGTLFEYHYGEGAYDETERAIQELLGVGGELLTPVRPEDVPGAPLTPQTEDQPGAYSGPYEAGGVWAVLDGAGHDPGQRPRGRRRPPRGYLLVEHPTHREAVLDLVIGPGVTLPRDLLQPGRERPAWPAAVVARPEPRPTAAARAAAGRSARGCGRRAAGAAAAAPSSSTTTAAAGPVGALGRGRSHEPAVEAPGAGVDQARAGRRRPFRPGVAAGAGRRGGCGRR